MKSWVLKIRFFLLCCIWELIQHTFICEYYSEFVNQMHKEKASRLKTFWLKADSLVCQKRRYFKKKWIQSLLMRLKFKEKDQSENRKNATPGKRKHILSKLSLSLIRIEGYWEQHLRREKYTIKLCMIKMHH